MLKALLARLENLARERTNTNTIQLPTTSHAARFLEAWKKNHASEIAAEQAAENSASQTLLERHFAKLRIQAPPEIRAALIQIRRGGGIPASLRSADKEIGHVT